MSLRKFIKRLPLLLSLSVFASAQAGRAAQASRSKQSQIFQSAKMVTTPSATAFEFEMSGFTYHISDNGNGRRLKGDSTRRFNLGLFGPYLIRAMYYAEYQGNVLLVCGVTDGDMFQGFITRLEQPSMRSLWKQTIPDLIGGEPLRVKQYLYVTGRGFVGMIDLKNGAYVWQHDKLNERGVKGNFVSFARPEVNGEEVVFKEQAAYDHRAASVVVNKKTGKIIRIE